MNTLKNHQEELTTQILMNGEVRKKNRMDFLNEGSRARQQVHAALLSNPTPTPLLTLTLTLTHPDPNPYSPYPSP